MQRTGAESHTLPDPDPGAGQGEGPDGRLTLDEYFMRMAHLVKQRGTCRRRKVGAVVVRDKMVVSTGYNNVSVKGGTLYCTTFPCNFCAKAIVNAGVREIVYEEGYPDDLSRRILDHTDLVLRRYSTGGVSSGTVRPEPGKGP